MSHNFGLAVQAPVGIHESWKGVEEEEEEGGRGKVVVVAVAGVERGRPGTGWVLYKEVRTPNSQFQWDFLRWISDPLDHHQIIYADVHHEVFRIGNSFLRNLPCHGIQIIIFR